MRPSDFFAPSDVAAPEPPQTRSRRREEIPDRFKWNLTDIFPSWEAWEAGYKQLEAGIERYAALQGHARRRARAAARRVPAVRRARPARLSRLVLPVAAIRRGPARQHRQREAPAGADPVRASGSRRSPGSTPSCCRSRSRRSAAGWTRPRPCAFYRFAIEDLYRQQEHVLDEAGERLMSLASRLAAAPNDAYWALSTADAKFPTITLSNGEAGHRLVRAVPRASSPRGASRRTARPRSRRCTTPTRPALNTYATLYNGVCQRDWFQARARGYKTTLEAALHGDNIPTSVVENLIETTRAGVEPLRRYHRLRRTHRSACRRTTSTTSPSRSSPSTRSTTTTTCSTGSSTSVAPLGPRLPGADARGVRAAAGSTSTRTRASDRAPIRRRCTARIRTCC